MERLPERVQAMLDQLFQSTLQRMSKSQRQVIKENEQSAKLSKCFSRYVLALWLRAPIDMAKYSYEFPEGENSNRWGPV